MGMWCVVCKERETRFFGENAMVSSCESVVVECEKSKVERKREARDLRGTQRA